MKLEDVKAGEYYEKFVELHKKLEANKNDDSFETRMIHALFYPQKRFQSIEAYGFSIITPRGVLGILEFVKDSVVLSVGCGKGYNEYLLSSQEQKIEIIATDLIPPSVGGNDYFLKQDEFLPVLKMSAIEAIDSVKENIANVTLMISWPCNGDIWAFEALKHFTELGGKKLVYIGEFGGCCAERSFFDYLDDHWEYEVVREGLLRWKNLKDALFLFTKKG